MKLELEDRNLWLTTREYKHFEEIGFFERNKDKLKYRKYTSEEDRYPWKIKIKIDQEYDIHSDLMKINSEEIWRYDFRKAEWNIFWFVDD